MTQKINEGGSTQKQWRKKLQNQKEGETESVILRLELYSPSKQELSRLGLQEVQTPAGQDGEE